MTGGTKSTVPLHYPLSLSLRQKAESAPSTRTPILVLRVSISGATSFSGPESPSNPKVRAELRGFGEPSHADTEGKVRVAARSGRGISLGLTQTKTAAARSKLPRNYRCIRPAPREIPRRQLVSRLAALRPSAVAGRRPGLRIRGSVFLARNLSAEPKKNGRFACLTNLYTSSTSSAIVMPSSCKITPSLACPFGEVDRRERPRSRSSGAVWRPKPTVLPRLSETRLVSRMLSGRENRLT